MQFHKIKPQTPNLVLKSHDFDGRKVCSCCQCQPVLGYAGNGTVINDLCRKCWRSNGEARERASMKTWTAAKGARS